MIIATALVNGTRYRFIEEEGTGPRLPDAGSFVIQSQHDVNGEPEWETIATSGSLLLARDTWQAVLIADRRGRL